MKLRLGRSLLKLRLGRSLALPEEASGGYF